MRPNGPADGAARASSWRTGLVDVGSVYLCTTTGLLGARQLLLGEVAAGLLLGLAAAATAALRLRQSRPVTPIASAAALGLAFASWAAAVIALASVRGDSGRLYFCMFDDAFVSLRYAWNLAHGQGLVWNLGERVQGYTNLLWTLAMAVPCLLLDRARAALAVQLLGSVSLLWTAFAGWGLARRLGAPPLLAFGLVLGFYPLAYWSVLGMEAGLLAALLTTAVLVAVEERRLADWRLPLLLGLAVATRPDAMLPAAALLGWRARWAGLRTAGRESAAFAAVPLAIAAFQWTYYGSLVPNTYVLKVEGLPLLHRLRAGGGSALVFLAWIAPLLVLAVAGRPWRDARKLAPASVFVAAVAAHVYMGGDAWPRWRFVCPALPLLAVLAADGAGRLAKRFRREALGALALAGALLVANLPFLKEAVLATYPFGVTDVQVLAGAADRLIDICTPEARVGVFYAGVVPYYTGLRAIDFLGKTDPHVAHLAPRLTMSPGHNKSDLRYSIGQLAPDYVEDLLWADDSPGAAVTAQYVRVEGLWLRRGSARVRWDRVRGEWASPPAQKPAPASPAASERTIREVR